MLRLFWVALYFLSVWASPLQRDDGSRILNGNVATEGQFPFAVSVQEFSEGEGHKHICTFSLITTKTCLGAAHCAFDKDDHSPVLAENLCGIVGSTVQSNDVPCHKFASIYPHEDFNFRGLIHDIVLAIFEESITLGPNIDISRLAGPNVDILGESVTALGWGMKKPGGPASDELRYTFLNVVELSMCDETLDFDDVKMRDDQVCLFKDGAGTCSGDSGAPIVLTGTNVEIALVSYGIEVCGSLPAVYTDVRKYIDWIKEHSEGEPEIKE